MTSSHPVVALVVQRNPCLRAARDWCTATELRALGLDSLELLSTLVALEDELGLHVDDLERVISRPAPTLDHLIDLYDATVAPRA